MKTNSEPEVKMRFIDRLRINWLFFASPAGARTSALFFSLIETAKANNIEPDAYFRFLFVEVPKVTSDADLRTLLPQHLDRSRLPKLRNQKAGQGVSRPQGQPRPIRNNQAPLFPQGFIDRLRTLVSMFSSLPQSRAFLFLIVSQNLRALQGAVGNATICAEFLAKK